MDNTFDQFDNQNVFDQFDQEQDSDNNQNEVKEPTWNFGQGLRDHTFKGYLPEGWDQWVPDPAMPGFIPPRQAENLIGGVYNAPRNLVETGLAIDDTVFGRNNTEKFSSNVPKYQRDDANFVDEIVTSVPEFVGGAAGGAKVAGKIASKTPKLIEKGARFLGSGLGAATLADEDVGGIIFDKDGVVDAGGTVSALGINRDGQYSDEVLQKRVNLFLDALIVGKAAEVGIRGATKTLELGGKYLVKPLLGLTNQNEIELSVYREVIDSLSDDVLPTDTPEQIAKKEQRVIDAVRKYKKFFLESGDEEIGNVEFKRDTISAYEKDLGKDEGYLIAKARGIRAGMEGKGAPRLEAALAEPSKETERFVDKQFEVGGGSEGIDKTTKSIQDRTYEQTNAVIDEVDKAKQRIIDSEEGAKALIRDDPTFGKMLEDLGDEVNIDFTGPNKTLDEILANINEASRIMTDKKNTLWKAIPDDVTVNVETFNNTLESIGKSLDDNLRKSLGEAGDNFKKLDEFASTTLQDAISVAVKNGEFQKVKDLRSLKRHIQDEQLNYIAEEGYEAAEKAYDYYKNTYAPFWRDGPLEDIQRIQRDKSATKPLETQYETRSILKNTFGDPDKEGFTQRIIDLLNTEEGKKSSGKVLDYVLGTVAQDVQRILNNGKKKLSPEDISSLSKTLEAYVPVFKKVDETQVSRINEFLTKLRDKNFSTEELKQQLEIFEKQAKTVEEDLLGGRFKEFFRKEGSQYLPRSNTDDIYKGVFDDPDVVDKLPDLIKQAGKENEKGLRAAWAKHLKDKVLKFDEDVAGGLQKNPVNKNELNKIYEAGKILYEDKPQIVEITKNIIDELHNTRKGTTRKQPTFDTSQLRKGASGVSDFIITFIFGPLSRTGSRVRSATGRIMANLDPSQRAIKIMDKMYSDPDYFLEIAEKAASDSRKPRMSTQAKKEFLRGLGLSVTFGEDEVNEAGDSTDLIEMINPKKKSLDDQTNENLKFE